MSRNILTRLAACAVTLSLAAPIAAEAQQGNEDWQTIDVLTDMVANAMGRNATPVDRRIKLARCPEQASVTALDAQTLAVRCASLGWRLRVPMTAPAGASPVAATPRGSMLAHTEMTPWAPRAIMATVSSSLPLQTLSSSPQAARVAATPPMLELASLTPLIIGCVDSALRVSTEALMPVRLGTL